MPAGPTPIYVVTYGGSQFPGYVQGDEQPLSFRTIQQGILNRNGGINSFHGAEARQVNLEFIVLSTLDNVSELDHLNNCKDQYRQAVAICANATGPASLKVGDTDRHLNAIPTDITAPLVAGTSRSIRYKVTFVADPYYIDDTPVSGSFSGNTTVNLSMTDNVLTTYPIFEIPGGVTAFTATHAASGKVVDFARGSFVNTIIVDCGSFDVYKPATGTNASSTMQDVDYGIRHTGSGTLAIVITNYSGSGTVDVDAYPRYPL